MYWMYWCALIVTKFFKFTDEKLKGMAWLGYYARVRQDNFGTFVVFQFRSMVRVVVFE